MTSEFLQRFHPEVNAGGFPAHDGTIEFYGRIRALLQPDMVVVDFGAGRAAWAHCDPCEYRKRIRDLRDAGVKLIGCDIDPAIEQNPVLSEKSVLKPNSPLPYRDSSVDIVIADYVLEHLADAEWFGKEVDRVLKAGGWFCARTPTRYHYVVLASTMLPDQIHRRLLSWAQADRKAEDVFEAHYKFNTAVQIQRYFPESRFENHCYVYTNSPQYHFNKAWIYRLMSFAHAMLPRALHGNIFLFLHKKPKQV